jgi:F0F1-type ATP synthase membrane subunit b/b'
MNMGRAGLKELMAWDLFKWIVVALLAANLLLVVGLYNRIRSDLADLKQGRTALDHAIGDTKTALADARTALGKDIATAKAGLAQAVSEMRSGVEEEIAKANAKLDTLIEASRKPQSEKPRR